MDVDARSADAEVVPAEPAALSRRFLALMIDWVLCLLIGAFIGRLMGSQPWQAPVVLVAEYTVFLGVFAQTPGMYVVKLTCVALSTGGPIGIPRAFVRAVLLALLVPALILDKAQRGLHDRAVGSIVVKIKTQPQI